MEILEYPFDSEYILQKKKQIKKQLLETKTKFIEKNIAILGGSTTNDIKLILELFLLNHGIKCNFYESEYGQYYQDSMFENEALKEFKPDVIYIHTTNRNISQYPAISWTKEKVDDALLLEYMKFKKMWDNLHKNYGCPIIQNNFEYPFYRIMGNKEASSPNGKINYITRLNLKFYEYANENANFYINDINYISSAYGLDKWTDNFYWYMYKYALAVPAIPTLAFNVANIIKSIFGKNKKAFVLDLDNTLWGGVVGDDGVEGIKIGQEVPEGQVYSEFQKYIKENEAIGVILNINSKNEQENAIAGLKHPDGTLKPEDFICIKANWNAKSENIVQISNELNIGLDSLVFVDDNPAEREIIRQQTPTVAVPEINTPEQYIKMIDKSGFFEVTTLSNEDLNKTKMYKENEQREKLQMSFKNYDEYLKSLKMKATIKPFEKIYFERISQLTNKSNQFNLTTKRYTVNDIEQMAQNSEYITLYGKLEDCFGDNGIVSVVIGHKKGKILEIELWLMSCRVLKRGMEFAMMNSLMEIAKENGIETIKGYYYPTTKNAMVKDFYANYQFRKISEAKDGKTIWNIQTKEYQKCNNFIEVDK